MYIEPPKELLKKCYIKPFENIEGTILAIKNDKYGSEVLVRYISNGMIINNWFFDSELELKKDKIKKNITFFKEY